MVWIPAITFNEFYKFSLNKASIKKENKVSGVKFGSCTSHPKTQGGLLRDCSVSK